MSPITSSSVKRTAATGVLKAAATAAAELIGISDFTRCGLKPSLRPSVDAMPPATCTEGPSRPNLIPLASAMEEQQNLPTAGQRNHTVADEQGRLGLGNIAAARLGKIAAQQEASDEGVWPPAAPASATPRPPGGYNLTYLPDSR
jgi:hypothetical protein